MNLNGFKDWLTNNTDYSKATIGDTVSRVRRADKILPWYNDIVYQFRLEQEEAYQEFSCSVRSQIKKAVKLYFEFEEHSSRKPIINREQKNGMRVLSLFSNIGVSEAYFKSIGIDVVVANELVERRAKLYSSIYPDAHMICGDITQQQVHDEVVKMSLNLNVDIIMATPPCQGMSTAGQQIENDERNKLICPVVDIIKQINPRYVFLENVPLFLNTPIEINGNKILILDYVKKELESQYKINTYIIDTKDYSVPQTRERAIILMTRKSENKEWILPKKDNKILTMFDAIGHLPNLDPFVKDISEYELLDMFPHYYERKEAAEKISKWHIPPHHIKRQVVAMQHTPTGCTAFDNLVYYPVKADGSAVKGYRNTYKRQNWKTAAYTATMDNRKISSQNNVHPGRLEYVTKDGEEIYSDARTLTLYELMTIMSLPEDWPVPENTSEAFLRRVIGEGIPPLFVKKVFENLK
jgi:DNA (cytosine-5)-methyltransferase 1